jgi:ubiquinone/menaquinone biosynthesis C-methylase UbiE
MPTPSDHPQPESSYQVDAENAAEMARLIRQARMLTLHLGLFPSSVDLSKKHAFLDIGCGPGEWVLSIAEQFPASRVSGIDISELMIRYASFSAELQHLANVQFQVMDARQPLAFPDASFDVIHARFITGFQSTTTWPLLLRECFRLLRPGGIICNTEFEELGVSPSLALTRYNHLVVKAARQAGQCFTEEGDQYGITAVLARLLQKAGFGNIQQEASVLNYSAAMPAHASMYDNFNTFLKLLQPFLVRSNVASQEELDSLYEQVMAEMQDEDFCAVAYFQRAWAVKPIERGFSNQGEATHTK